jgi:hypothetical protein
MANNEDPKREQRTKAEKRRHHYTPVLYLRNFTDAGSALHAIYLPAGNRAQTAPEALGFERDLYRPDFEELDPNVYEDIFGEFEGEAAPVIREVSETRTLPTDEERLNILFNFIAFQSVRLPSTKRAIAAPIIHTYRIIESMLAGSKELYETHAKEAGIDITKHPHERYKAGLGKYKMKMTTDAFVDHAMTMTDTMLPLVASRNWGVLYSERPGEQFVITDRPVALRWSNGSPPNFYGPGHGHMKTDLTIPISASVMLVGRFEAPITSGEATREQVATLNGRTITGAQRFVATCSDDFIVEGPIGILTADEYIAVVKAGPEASRIRTT